MLIAIVDTGLRTLTGGRLKRMKKFIKEEEDFMFTYGDGVSDINLDKLLDFIKIQKTFNNYRSSSTSKICEIILKNNLVKLLRKNHKQYPVGLTAVL